LNTLEIRGCLWLAADIHLGDHNPATARAFYQFLHQAREQCDALILCGDIFNAWVGDDQTHCPEPWLFEAMQALQTFSRHKPLYLMRGNRDFLLGQAFAHAVGATLLPDALRVRVSGAEAEGEKHDGFHSTFLPFRLTFWLTHGDELCTADIRYQRFRRWVRNPVIQRLFLACPLRWRRALAAWIRRRSQRAGAYKHAQANSHISDISNVSAAACQQRLVREDLNILVHGHTHRPAIHRPDPSRKHCRIVLPDWELDATDPPPRYGWISVNENGFALHQPLHQPECAEVFSPAQTVQTPTAIIILAAGMSRRMGARNKLLLPINGQAMIRAVAEQAVQALQANPGCGGKIIVVLGHEAQQVHAALQDLTTTLPASLPLIFVHNPDYAQGMGTSVGIGAQHVPAGHAALVCLGDMPFVTAATLQALIQAGQPSKTPPSIAACQPCHAADDDKRHTTQHGNPIWWAPDQIQHLQTLTGDTGARTLLQNLCAQGRVLDVPVPDPGILTDIDTPQAWQALG